MASVRPCVSVKSVVSPVQYRSTRILGAVAGSGTLRIRSSSLLLNGKGGRNSTNNSGRGDLREVLAMYSASFDGVRPAAAVVANSAVQLVPAFLEHAKVAADTKELERRGVPGQQRDGTAERLLAVAFTSSSGIQGCRRASLVAPAPWGGVLASTAD